MLNFVFHLVYLCIPLDISVIFLGYLCILICIFHVSIDFTGELSFLVNLCITLYYFVYLCITGQVSLGGTADSFYEYLIKSYAMTSRNDTEAAHLFFDAIEVRIATVSTREPGCFYSDVNMCDIRIHTYIILLLL